MRWKINGNPNPGDTRTITKFLIFPTAAGDEMRWLEKATIEQEAVLDFCGCALDPTWTNKRFIDAGSPK